MWSWSKAHPWTIGYLCVMVTIDVILHCLELLL